MKIVNKCTFYGNSYLQIFSEQMYKVTTYKINCTDRL